MKIERKTAMSIWEAYFDGETEVTDAFGRTINKANYENDSNNSGEKTWTIDHIWPKHPDSETTSQGGANTYSNVQILHWESNQDKSNKLQGIVNGVPFAVKKIDENEGKAIGRMRVKYDDEWQWAYDEPNY